MKAFFAYFCWLLACGCTGLGGCKPKQSPVVVPLVLLAPATITPSSATVHVGDTLWLTTIFADSLVDRDSGKRYRIRPQDMTLRPGIAIERLQGTGRISMGVANTFRVVEKTGTMSIGGQSTGDFFPVYDGQFYRARFGLIPTQPGITSISLLLTPLEGRKAYGNFLPFMQLPPDAQGQERKALLDGMFFVINEGKATNYDLFRRWFTTDPETSGAPDASLFYDRNSTFTVEVK